jgi:hypothetical protein
MQAGQLDDPFGDLGVSVRKLPILRGVLCTGCVTVETAVFRSGADYLPIVRDGQPAAIPR